MARISTYTKDTQINKEDIIIGSDGAEGAGFATKNFTVESLTAHMQGNLSDIEVVGLQGPQGEQGPQGPAGAVGPAGLNWQGTWVSGNNYVEDDAVSYSGASYFCIADATGRTTPPSTDTSYWALLAAQGATGAAGARGPRGYGISGASGSYYNDLGNIIVTPTDDSEYKVTLTFEDGTTLLTDDIRGAKGAQGDVSTAGTVTSVDSGPGLTGGAITSSGTISVDYDTSSNIVTDAYNSAGTDIETDDKILYGDSDDGNIVNYGLVSDLPFTNNSGTVTSVGLGTGTNGTDINVSGSPITTSGSITLNIPSASATNRGALTSADWSTFNSKIDGTATTGNTAPTEIRVMTESEYSAPGFTPANDIIYVLV